MFSKTAFEFSPFTFGYNGENLKHYDRCLTAKEDIGSFQTLDYIFDLKFKKNNLRIMQEEDSSTNQESNKTNTKLKAAKSSFIKTDDRHKNYLDLTDVGFEVNEKPLKKTASRKHQLFIDYNSAQVESFLVSDKTYQQLSDHFGLSVDLKFREFTPNEV